EGFTLHGVDQSEGMSAQAKARCPHAAFHLGDVRDVRLGGKVDAVLSLLHVVSYQTGNDDGRAMFATAAEDLNRGGIVFFGVSYGPAVLTDRPSVRVKELQDDVLHITRVATPTLHATRNMVDVHYHIAAFDKKTGAKSETEETHHMRYFFTPE